MQFSPIEIKEKLTRALDDDNNVSDIRAVLEVISTLESYPITREALEQTRIGKLVNELRKKTTNDDLARRAKKLVRSWHKLISPSDNSVNGERINANSLSPGMTVYSGAGSQPVSPASLHCSPALSRSSPCGLSMSNKIHSPCLRLNASPWTSGLYPVSPKVDPNGIQRSNISPNSVCPLRFGPSMTSTPKGSNISPKTMCPRRLGTPSSSKPKEHSPNMSSSSSTPTSKGICPNPPYGNSASNEGRCENNYKKNELCSPAGCDRNCVSKEKTSLSKVGSLHLGKCSPISNHSKDRFNAGIVNTKNAVKGNLSKKRTLNDPGGGPPAKRVPPPEKYVAKDLHSKEKTVNGILYGMCPNIESSEKKKTNEVLAKSKSVMDNCVMYVSGDSNDSFKNSANKRNLTVKQDKTKTSKVKTTAQLIAELQAKSGGSSSHLKGDVIEKIRANQIKRESSNNILPSDIHLKSNKRDSRQPHNMLSQAKNELVQKFLQTSVRPNDIKEESESPLSMEMDRCRLQLDCILPDGPTPMTATQQSLLDIYNSLPPLNLDQIDWEEDNYEVQERTQPVVDEDVDRLHLEQWSGVNGMCDSLGMWRDWTQTMSAESLDGSRLELLPYVNIE